MTNAITKKVNTINEILGYEVVSVDDVNDEIVVDYNGNDGYTIVCDDEDDVFNTLSSMLDGMLLLRSVRGII